MYQSSNMCHSNHCKNTCSHNPSCCNHGSDCCDSPNYYYRPDNCKYNCSDNPCCDNYCGNTTCCDTSYYNNDCCHTPCHNNGYYGQSNYSNMSEALCCYLGKKVIICIDGKRLCVVLCEICDCFIKALAYKSGKTVYINICKIDDIKVCC